MKTRISDCGIIHRLDDGATIIVRSRKNGGPPQEIEVSARLADEFRLATGDIVDGQTVLNATAAAESAIGVACAPDVVDTDEQIDEPGVVRQYSLKEPSISRSVREERLETITGINGLSTTDAADRPWPRTRRSPSERTAPHRQLHLAVGQDDYLGRILDFAAPLGAGTAGVIRGPHGAGLTTTLQAVLNGVVANSTDCIPIVLLLRARSEEITAWRRQWPHADTVVCSSAFTTVGPEDTLKVADLVLESCQRLTEMGSDVVLLVNSLTGLWGAMLEAESADAQREADQSAARQRMRSWLQRAGAFHGEMPLGGSLGGSLTLVGTVWDQPVDVEAEEDRDLHPHLRLMEHIVHDTAWRIPLSSTLSEARLYPAIDTRGCTSLDEERFLPRDTFETLLKARGTLPRNDPTASYFSLMEALHASMDQESLMRTLSHQV